jgi:hypothetical protein
MGKTEEKRPLERPKGRLEDNITMGLQGVRWGMDYIDLARIETGGGLL